MRTRRRAIIATRGHHAPTPGRVTRSASLEGKVSGRTMAELGRMMTGHVNCRSAIPPVVPIQKRPRMEKRQNPRIGEEGVERVDVDQHGRVNVTIRLHGLDRLAKALDAASVKLKEFGRIMGKPKGGGHYGFWPKAVIEEAERMERDDHRRRIVAHSAELHRSIEHEPMRSYASHVEYGMVPLRETTTLTIEGHLA